LAAGSGAGVSCGRDGGGQTWAVSGLHQWLAILIVNRISHRDILLGAAVDSRMEPICKNCKNLMIAPSASTLYRCGVSYFTVPAKDRQAQPMNLYPVTTEDDSCDRFRPHGYLAALKLKVA
jgi:hypothetical protein